MSTALPTQNEAWGFYGTISHHTQRPDLAYGCASDAIAHTTGAEPEAVRAFLDSRYGRHFADQVADHLNLDEMAMPYAIERAIATWSAWRIGRATSRATGIPVGLPYLMGFVEHARIEADAAGEEG
jgi:hypothetical protein